MLEHRREGVEIARAAMPAARGVSLGLERRCGGFSLIELMIAIAILVALTALVLPAGMGWIARERFVEAGRQLPAALATARADARHDGVARRVTASVNEAGRIVIMAQRLDVAAMEAEAAASDATAADARTVASEQRPAKLLMELPAGCGIVSSAGAEPDAEATSDGDREQVSGGDGSGTAKSAASKQPVVSAQREDSNLPVEPVTVVVYLADGGAVAPAKTLLTGPGGRLAPIWFDRWTGRAHVGERVTLAPAAPESADRDSTGAAEDRSSMPANGSGEKGS